MSFASLSARREASTLRHSKRQEGRSFHPWSTVFRMAAVLGGWSRLDFGAIPGAHAVGRQNWKRGSGGVTWVMRVGSTRW